MIHAPPSLLERTVQEWRGLRGRGQGDLWVFGYASLIWRPEFDYLEQRAARVHGWHRALKMWSRVNRGTHECPGLVFCLLAGGSCCGMVFRIAEAQGEQTLARLWEREMPIPVYQPRWLPCRTPAGTVRALAFTLAREHPSHTGELAPEEYRRIFRQAQGRYGSTQDYARATYEGLRAVGIHDRVLERLIATATRDPAE
ncbi:MAG: gamma-glutamylcyclotransferase [Burkholderiaceae bacterium]|nr:gamma-glutamylcyclotransferase [Burkholderiaceae bacterium]